MKNQQVIKLFLVLIISTIYIFSFSQLGAFAYNSILHKNDHFAEGTMIGSVSVAGMTRNEATQLLNEEIMKWQNEITLTVQYKEKSVEFDVNIFTFDIENSLLKASPGQSNPIQVQLDDLNPFLYSISSTIMPDDFRLNELEAKIIASAQMLETGSHQINLVDFLVSHDDQFTILEEAVISMSESEELIVLTDHSIEVKATSQFSLLQFIEEQGLIGFSPLSLNKVATAIYQVILPTNFSIIERHISTELPDYASLGYEAKIDVEQNQDLIFSNPNKFSYFIEFEEKDGKLSVNLNGPSLLNQYVITFEDQESFQPKTILQFNPQLGPKEIRVKNEGKNGKLIKVYREYLDEEGKLLEKERIAEDFYAPIHRIEVSGLIVNEGNSTTTETDENTDSDENDEEINKVSENESTEEDETNDVERNNEASKDGDEKKENSEEDKVEDEDKDKEEQSAQT